jgi:hypothetical protein
LDLAFIKNLQVSFYGADYLREGDVESSHFLFLKNSIKKPFQRVGMHQSGWFHNVYTYGAIEILVNIEKKIN